MKIGDLVTVGHPKHAPEFVTVVTDIWRPEKRFEGIPLIEVLEPGVVGMEKKWYPIGYIKVINESR